MGSTRLLPFLFGVTCPLAAHIRKVNIRDSSSDMADQAKPVLTKLRWILLDNAFKSSHNIIE
jgi:hypothetical protein